VENIMNVYLIAMYCYSNMMECVTLLFEPALCVSGCVHKSGQEVTFIYVFLWHVMGMVDKVKL